LFVDTADTVDPHNITIDTKISDDTGGQVRISWSDPPSPNGQIVLYDIELVKADVANVSSYTVSQQLCFLHSPAQTSIKSMGSCTIYPAVCVMSFLSVLFHKVFNCGSCCSVYVLTVCFIDIAF